jgi:hypothetical protein
MTREYKPLKELIKEVEPEFFDNIDPNMKIFAREIKEELRNEGHVVIGITGYPGTGKSNATAILGCLIDDDYDFKKNICYIPTSKQIEEQYYGLKMYSFLHIDEASRGLHKHKWHDKIQQKLNELYDTEREGHFLATALIMPRFQNFTENFRNFMIKYWIHIPVKGLAIFYKKDEDKDCKDPWHLDENYKKKKDRWRGKRVFERDLPSVVRMEQNTDCYWFYCKIPAIPKQVWEKYQDLKAGSRVIAREANLEVESYKDKMNREKMEKWDKITTYKAQGRTHEEIAVLMGIAVQTVRRTVREIETYQRLNGISPPSTVSSSTNIYNQIE